MPASGRRWGRPRPAAATCWSSPTTTPAPRTPPRSARRCSPASPPTGAATCWRSATAAPPSPPPSPAPGPATPSSWPARATRPARRWPAPCIRSTTGPCCARPWCGARRPEWSRDHDRAREVVREHSVPEHGVDERRWGDPVIPLTLAEVAEAVGGRLTRGDGTVTGRVTLDSRAVAPGDLFVAVPGERVDGHDFLGAAAAAGAVAALSTRPDDALPCVVVGEPVAALGRLAAAVHTRLAAGGLTTLGITGSSGKTSTKDLLGQVLATAGPTVSPPGSYNNDIGLPLTVLDADATTRYLVLEMGSRGPGHIARLCRVARPQIGVVLNVGSAHLGEFGSPEGIAQAKGELIEALPADGTAVLNADDPRVLAMASRTRARVVTTGRGPDADVRATDVALDEQARARFTLAAQGASAPVAL